MNSIMSHPANNQRVFDPMEWQADKRFLFWRNWLLAVCVIVVAFGLAIALLSWSPLFTIFDSLVSGVFWPGSAPGPEAKSFMLFAYGMLGATMAGWGITLAYIVVNPFSRKEPWARDAIALGLAVWFIVDTLMTVFTEAYFNVGVNVLLIVLAGVPLLATRGDFRE